MWRHIPESTLAHVMTCCLTAPSHYLKQCWLIIKRVLWYCPFDIFFLKCSRYKFVKSFWKIELIKGKLLLQLPGANELNVCCYVSPCVIVWYLYINTRESRCDCVSSLARSLILCSCHGPLTRYAKLRVAHASGMPGTFFPRLRVSDPDMHHGAGVTHVQWCMPGSLMSDFL